jgi:hypothetical protein
MTMIAPPLPRFVRAFVPVLLLAAAGAVGHAAPPAGAGAGSPPPKPVPQPRLEDFIAESGSTAPFMLHADLWLGIDQRAKLDTIVFVLDNGARCCKVLNRDSTWAVDYTWVYPHSLLPPRWYDARSLIQTGDSLKLPDDADLKLTFGTLRVGVHAGSLKQATAEAYRLWPPEIPPALRGRLKLKLERAQRALAGKSETEPEDGAPH